MRNKLILILFLLIVIFIFININKSKEVFIKNKEDISVFTNKDIKKVDNLILDLFDKNKKVAIKNIQEKYAVIESKKETQFCDKTDNTYLVSNEDGFDVVSYQNGSNFEYYKSQNGNCTLIGRLENVNFTDNSNETFANDSVYSIFDSLTNFDLSGLIRVKKDEVVIYDTLYKRYTNPISFNEGVLLIRNNRSIVAYDADDKIIFQQNNEKNNRNVLAINRSSNSLFAVVSENNKLTLEGYDINDIESIKSIKPTISYDISSYFKNINLKDTTFETKSSSSYSSFTVNGQTLVVSRKFDNVFIFENADTTLDINDNIIFLKNEELYYVVDLASKEKEEIGQIKALALKILNRNMYFSVLDSQNKEAYIKFTIR